ncbi:hypothetical protein [Sphingomonas sp. Root241]|uniref:hypothetical protein n=1 Tax=Sphingomonas sp. Root241 TaxID=1736501 RepID=UPI0006FA6598|nr:hypothetical protein [Sphingomonas sp. Root241]KRC81834.1 hypothetical protein ASE13_05585 [Sphingomonas sp. Root241]
MATMIKTHGKAKHANECCCPACTGLTNYERPLFATGQTLTAADLTALQSYVAGKNRLHNRYLHGWGVVCGLEVVCDDCEGSVTIRPGYAIDPCGADIVVAQPVRFDVVKAIRDCEGQARPKTGDCDPWMPPPDPGCADALGHWCIALKYREVETAVSQRLTSGGSACGGAAKPAGGDCGCGGGCGGGGGCNCQPKAVVNAPPVSTITANNSCAPRRVTECFDVSLIRSAEACAPTFDRFDRGSTDDDNPLGNFDWLIPKRSLLRNIIDCILGDLAALQERMTDQELALVVGVAMGDPAELADEDPDLDAIHAAVCKFRGAVVSALASDSFPTRCQLRRAAGEVTLRAPTNDDEETLENRTEYIELAKEAATDLIAAFLQMLLDCVCHAFLPQCGENPCDDRVEIACVTVKAGKILSICNFSCRRYAGAFPSTVYWMSLIPILPLISRMLVMLCCQPDLLRRNSPLVNDLVPLLRTVDPTGRLGNAVVKNNFALPRRYLSVLTKAAKVPIIPAVVERLNRGVAKIETKGETAPVAVSTPFATKVEVAGEAAALRSEIVALRKEMAAMTAGKPKPAALPRKKGG